MNELDKQSPKIDDLNSEAAADAAAVTTDASSTVENAECADTCAEETSPSLDSSPAMDLAETADTAEASEESAEVPDFRNYHSLSKPEMVEALKEIIASGNMEAHKEVAAIKQAYYTVVNRDAMNELASFVEAGNCPDQFSATPDESEIP